MSIRGNDLDGSNTSDAGSATNAAEVEVYDESETEVETQTQFERPPAKLARKRFSWTLLNFLLDATLLIAVLGLVWVSAMMNVVFPPPTLADGWILWGLDYDRWHDVQTGFLMAAALLSLEHLVLHWSWVCGIIATKILKVKKRPDEAIQYMYGLSTFFGTMVTMAALITIAMFSAKGPTP